MSQKRAEGTRNALLFLSNLGVIQAMPTMFINLFLWPCFFMPLQYFSSQACFHQFISRDHRAGLDIFTSTLHRPGLFMATRLGMGLAGMSEMSQASTSRVRKNV